MKPSTIDKLKSIKANGNKFAAITAYDSSFAALIEAAEIENVTQVPRGGDRVET